MANTYFQFKQFRINQDKCAMKVCTDSCLFGAWVGNSINFEPNRILDIGTGTGLLALILAQKLRSPVDGVEINEAAAMQASENFRLSPWSEKLSLFHCPIQTFNNEQTYDLIISNPPFYEDDLRSDDPAINAARHDSTLILEMLLDQIRRLSSPQGSMAAIMIPAHRKESFLKMMSNKGIKPVTTLNVRQTPQHDFFRTMILAGTGWPYTSQEEEEISIKDEIGEYTEAFRKLLKDYYLHL